MPIKPKYVFSSVFLICILMGIILPQAAHPSPAASAAVAQAAPAQESPPTAQDAQAEPAALPAETPGASSAAEAEVLQPGAPNQSDTAQAGPLNIAANAGLPSPADLQASAGQGLVKIPETSSLPGLEDFAASVSDGRAGRLAGVYVPGQLALPVIQQPAGQPNFVDTNDHTVTEYSRSTAHNVVGLLAHNTLSSGQSFFKLRPGMDVILVYGNGRQARYRIERIENYQALRSTDPYSDFIDLNGPGGELVSNEELFRRIYATAGQLIFQTCFEANGDPSWGRMFVIAKPV